MACVTATVIEAAVTAVAAKAAKKHEANEGTEVTKIPFSRKLKWLSNMLWGGSALLIFEHIWHGEIVPWFPFLTAAENPADASLMLHEMATVGVGMVVAITAVWAGIVAVVSAMEKKALKAQTAED